jgi:hypothetical protein
MPTSTRDHMAAAAIDELPQLWDGFAKLVRTGLDIRAFGVQLMDLPPDYTTGSHDEADTGQEELYVALRVLCVGGVPGAAYEPPEWTA